MNPEDLISSISEGLMTGVSPPINFSIGSVNITLTFDPNLLFLGSPLDDPLERAANIATNIATVITNATTSDTFMLHVATTHVRHLELQFKFRPGESSMGDTGGGASPNPILPEDYGIAVVNFADLNKEYLVMGSDGVWYAFNLQHIFNHEIMHALTGEPDGPYHSFLVDSINGHTDGGPPRADYDAVRMSDNPPIQFCFAAGTPIRLYHGSVKPIENVRRGDVVLSYNARGELVPGRVVRTFQKEVSHLLCVHGLKVTPGHVALCGDGIFKNRHVPIVDIILSDGALVAEDGSLIRIAINATVGSLEDCFIKMEAALTPEDAHSGNMIECDVRVGTLLFDRDGKPISILDCIRSEGYDFNPETGLISKSGMPPHPLRWHGKPPQPEDYILHRSRETLEGIAIGNEWESSRSTLIGDRLSQLASTIAH